MPLTVQPHERELYKQFCETMQKELAPLTLLEQSLAAEITGASWRLRRCSAAEAELADYTTQDPLFDEKTEKTRKSIERARAGAHSLLHRSINQLRRLQTDRLAASEIFSPHPRPACAGLADYKQIAAAVQAKDRAAAAESKQSIADFEAFCEPPQMASFCKPEIQPAPATPQTPRNALCPCKSGQKFKRCRGRNAPPVLNRAA